MGDRFVHIKDLLKEAYERAEKLDQNKDFDGIRSGLKGLDAILGGFQPSDLVILAARPSVGKSSCALGFALDAAIEQKKK